MEYIAGASLFLLQKLIVDDIELWKKRQYRWFSKMSHRMPFL